MYYTLLVFSTEFVGKLMLCYLLRAGILLAACSIELILQFRTLLMQY